MLLEIVVIDVLPFLALFIYGIAFGLYINRDENY